MNPATPVPPNLTPADSDQKPSGLDQNLSGIDERRAVIAYLRRQADNARANGGKVAALWLDEAAQGIHEGEHVTAVTP